MDEQNLSADRKGANAKETFMENYYEEKEFSSLALQDLDLTDVEFFKCEFKSIIMIKGKLSACRFENCTFISSDLSLLSIQDCSFTDVEFVNCKLLGIDWTKICLPIKIGFAGCKMNDSVFYGMDLRNIQMVSCEVRNVDFEKCNLSKSNLKSSDFLNSTFAGANLSFADLSDAKNYSINPTQSNIKKAKFSLPEVLTLLDTWGIQID